MKRLGILTSGGDAPGMNAAIRAVTREALARGICVTGFLQGYAGVLESKTIELTARAVGGVIQHGGTMLGSARSQEFCTEAGLERAIKNLQALQIEGLVDSVRKVPSESEAQNWVRDTAHHVRSHPTWRYARSLRSHPGKQIGRQCGRSADWRRKRHSYRIDRGEGLFGSTE
jgi:hypothetical protein